ncbi:MAG: hypothetical protein WC878_00540 [Candidatus Paceibacterota bacterium]|jgi:hypothetical protein
MEDVFQVWWSFSWKTGLTILGIRIALSLIVSFVDVYTADLLNGLSYIAYILVQLFFLKSSINKNYKNFRLSAVVNEKTTA